MPERLERESSKPDLDALPPSLAIDESTRTIEPIDASSLRMTGIDGVDVPDRLGERPIVDEPRVNEPIHTARNGYTLGEGHQAEVANRFNANGLDVSTFDAINPGFDQEHGRQVNCGEVARSVASTLDGQPTAAASLDGFVQGEHSEVMDEWIDGVGSEFTEHRYEDLDSMAGFSELEDRLDSLGPGNHAIVRVEWDGGGGHYFNAVNVEGRVWGIDFQQPGPESRFTFDSRKFLDDIAPSVRSVEWSVLGDCDG